MALIRRLFFLILCVCSSLYGQTEHYLVKLNYPDFGEMNFNMTFEKNLKDSSFIAYTNPESLSNLLSLKEKILVRIFSKGTKKGAVVQIPQGKISSKNHYEGNSISSLGNFSFSATKNNKNQLNGSFKNKKTQLDFSANLVQAPIEVEDYSELYKLMDGQFENQIYDPKILKRADWRHFLKNLRKSFGQSKDDLDLLTSFHYHANKLKTSHVFLTKMKVKEASLNSNLAGVELKLINDKTTLLTFNSFLLKDTAVVNKMMREINTPNLVVDLRSCPGGDFSSLLFASNFIKEEKNVGYFLGNKYYQTNDKLPNDHQINDFPVFSNGSLDDFFQIIEKNGALLGKVKPSKNYYAGKVYFLIGKNTASAAEPLAYFVKKNKIATLIGETTSGLMLSGKQFMVDKQWNLTLPVANYFTIDHHQLDQVGVKPDVEVNANQALTKALELIH